MDDSFLMQTTQVQIEKTKGKSSIFSAAFTPQIIVVKIGYQNAQTFRHTSYRGIYAI